MSSRAFVLLLVLVLPTVLAGSAFGVHRLVPSTEVASASGRVPGRLVDIGGLNLHLLCQGTGTPTVVVTAGLGDHLASWAEVVAAVSLRQQVCLYDRAGSGWSEDDPQAGSLDRMVHNLQALLERADVPGPYVLVGHAQGGLIAQAFAVTYPGAVRALVLVESTHYNQLALMPSAVARLQMSDVAAHRLCDADITLALHRTPSLINAYHPVSQPENLSPMHADQVIDTRYCASVRREADIFARAASRPDSSRRLDHTPLIVLTASNGAAADSWVPELGLTHDSVTAWDSSWMALQSSLARQSTHSEHRVVEGSGHFIQIDRPEAVASAIRDAAAWPQGRPGAGAR